MGYKGGFKGRFNTIHDVAAEFTETYLERRPVVLPVCLPRDEHPGVLQRQNHRRQLGAYTRSLFSST